MQVLGLPEPIARTVWANAKCESCMWFARLGGQHGTCEKALQPAVCGDGMMPNVSYWPIAGHKTTPGASVPSLHEQVGESLDHFVKSLVEQQAAFIRSDCPAHHSYSGMATNNVRSIPAECSCTRVELGPIAKAIYDRMSNRLRVVVVEEGELEDFVFKAMERVFASPEKKPPSVYLPGVHNPQSPVRANKKPKKVVAEVAKATNQPHVPSHLMERARNLHALKPQGIRIGSDHPLAHAVRTGAAEHVGATFGHFGTHDHAEHAVAHRQMAVQAQGSADSAAHDALAAAHTTYGRMKTHETYKKSFSYLGEDELDKADKPGVPKDPITRQYHSSHDDVQTAAKDVHAAGVGLHSSHPAAHKLRLAARRHGLVGTKFNDYPGSHGAAEFHAKRAEQHKGTPRGIAAEAISHYYSSEAPKSMPAGDLDKAWSKKPAEPAGTPHNHGANFGRHVEDCPRCAEIKGGAKPRAGWGDAKKRFEKISSEASRAHFEGPDHKPGGRCHDGVCTYGEW